MPFNVALAEGDEPGFPVKFEPEKLVLITTVARTRCERAILKRVCYWYPKAKTKRDNYIWIVKSADEFTYEGVDFAADTIRKAIRALKKRNLLVTERHFHPYRHYPGPVLWIRPAVPIIDDTGKAKPAVVPMIVNPWAGTSGKAVEVK